MKKTFWKSGIAVVALFVLVLLGKPTESRADFSVYDSLGPANPYSANGYSDDLYFGAQPFYAGVAQNFVPTVSGSLDGLILGMYLLSGGNSVTLSLLSSIDNSSPGPSVLWSQSFNQLGSDGSYLSISNLNGPMLKAGTMYWLEATGFVPESSNYGTVGWGSYYSGVTANIYAWDTAPNYGPNGNWFFYGNLPLLSMEVLESGVAPTPIPASFVLVGSGLLGLLGVRQRLLA